MGKISRKPAAAAREDYDLIIIGGGIYGGMLSLESSRRGLRSLLIERDDFGGATTFNSLRIIHGGFRYLQRFDIKRFRESVGEQYWFIQTFPDLVKPLPCLIPLYGNGLHRPSLFRLALWVNDVFSRRCNRGIPAKFHLPHGRIISNERTQEIFPSVDLRGLKGGAVWYDAQMSDSQHLLSEVLRWSCHLGGTALNYVEACQLLRRKNKVSGVMAIERERGETHEYKARVVINAAGPWCRDLAAKFHRDEPKLFRSSLAWNILLNKKTLSDHALAVAPKRPGGRLYFLVPWNGLVLAGTGHAPWHGCADKPFPSEQHLQMFLNDLNLAVPELALDGDDILHVFAGLLPATSDGSVNLASREVVLNHGKLGGPEGLYSVSGVKFTTSRLVAEKTLKQIFPEHMVRHECGSRNYNNSHSTLSARGVSDSV